MQTGNYDIEQNNNDGILPIIPVRRRQVLFRCLWYCSFWGRLGGADGHRTLAIDRLRFLSSAGGNDFPACFDHSINLLIFCSKQRLLSVTLYIDKCMHAIFLSF